jgi:hypothetical protein
VAAENEALRSENRQIQQQLKRMKKKKRRLKAELKKEREERANEKVLAYRTLQTQMQPREHAQPLCSRRTGDARGSGEEAAGREEPLREEVLRASAAETEPEFLRKGNS